MTGPVAASAVLPAPVVHGRSKIVKAGWVGGCDLGRDVIVCGVLRR
jgi:hypothetical protein